MKIGYFINPTKNIVSHIKTHLVGSDKIPVCSYRPNTNMVFCFCSYALIAKFVECKKCKKIVQELIKIEGGK